MKLTEKDRQDACGYIMEEACKAVYGDNYKEKGFRFDMQRMPITVREIIDLFIEWLKIKIANERTAKKDIVQIEDTQKP